MRKMLAFLFLGLLIGCAGMSDTPNAVSISKEARLQSPEARAAQEILDNLRLLATFNAGVSNYEFHAARLSVMLRRTGLELEDFGSSETELERIRLVVYIFEARKWVPIMRDEPLISDLVAARIRSLATRAKFSPRMAGTTEAELRYYEQRNFQVTYPRWWRMVV